MAANLEALEETELSDEEKQKRRLFLEGMNELSREYGYILQSTLVQVDTHTWRDELQVVKING